MSRVRKIEIRHFRGIDELTWVPSPGINCLIGPGDAGKSTVLDAIDFCLGARRNLQISDADFNKLDVSKPIEVLVTLGDLEDELKAFDSYGLYLRGFRSDTEEVLTEPESGAEVVITVRMTVDADLEPVWSLYSERAEAQEYARYLSWADRLKLAPTRLGTYTDHNLTWRRGSILNRVTEQKADATAALTDFAREARNTFGDTANTQVNETLAIVKRTAEQLGIRVGDVTAMLDAQSVSLSGGTISLHDSRGVPLRGLGQGSTRLLIAGLQREAAGGSSIILVDELEHGLEPHRIIRLIGSLGAKEEPAPLQVFMTTHSPVTVRELAAEQLYVLRGTESVHEVRRVGVRHEMQATLRACPEAFLAPSVIVCEGASEMGLLRGLDLHRLETGEPSFLTFGVSLADGRGETTFRRANAFASLGYRTAVLRDDDKQPVVSEVDEFERARGSAFTWGPGQAIEDALFSGLSEAAVQELTEAAVEAVGEDLVDANIQSASSGVLNLAECRNGVTAETRRALGKAAKGRRTSWFKSVTDMETVGRKIVGPDLTNASPEFRATIEAVFAWVRDGRI